MRYKKNQIVFAITIIVIALSLIGVFFVSGVRGILTGSTQTSLQEISEQGSNTVRSVLKGNLDTLSALSEQSSLIDQHDNVEQIKILATEAKRKNFLRVAYSDKSGHTVTSDGQTFSVGEREYFKKTLKGQPNISGEIIDLLGEKGKIIVYAVPVIRNKQVAGALIASVRADGNLNIMEDVAVDFEHEIYVLSRNGGIISNRAGQENIYDYFNYIGSETSKQSVARIQQDFLRSQSGKGAYTVNNVEKLVGYSCIQGTDGWMFMVVVDKGKIMAQANQILNMSALLFGVLILGFIVSSAYFYKLKISAYEVKLRRAEEIRYFIYTDTLTKMLNRKGIKKEIPQWLKRCRASAHNGGALFLDLDNFRSVNNAFGHSIGDKILAETALRLNKIKGEKNIAGRIGGDEFALLISDLDTAEELEKYAEHVLEIFTVPFLIYENVIQLTVSIGITLFDSIGEKSQNEFDDIINRGESILGEVKRLSKGSYALFDEEFGGIIEHQHKMEYELKNSILNNELTCYFQPLYNIEKNKIIGFESLARWNSPKFGMVAPSQFIEMAEKTGFIKELGRFVIQQAFTFAKSVQEYGVRVSFNSSPIELLQADYTDYVIRCFDDYGLTPKSIAVEITESCLIESFDEVIKKLKILGDHGIVVYLDDFGTGFSSLAYLKNLPIHSVKIDKSFIDEIATDDAEKDIVEMIVLLAHRLNFEVIAEGVETKEQMDCLSDCGCNVIQGYYISKPVPSSEARLLLDVLPK